MIMQRKLRNLVISLALASLVLGVGGLVITLPGDSDTGSLDNIAYTESEVSELSRFVDELEIAAIRNREQRVNRIFSWESDGTYSQGWGSHYGPGTDWKEIAAGDFDGDGIDEIVAVRANSGADFAVWKYDGVLVQEWNCLGSNTWRAIATGNFDSDDKDEIVAIREKWHNRGKWYNIVLFDDADTNFNEIRSFGKFGKEETGTPWKKVATGDINGNGIDEIIALREGVSGKYDKIFVWEDATEVLMFAWGGQDRGEMGRHTHWDDLSTGDFDGDGKDGLVAIRSNSGEQIFVWDGWNGSGFAKYWGITHNIPGGWREGLDDAFAGAKAGDVDGDGKDEIIVIETNDKDLECKRTCPKGDHFGSIYGVNGNGEFVPEQEFADAPWCESHFKAVAVGDIDVDGYDEVITVRDEVPNITVYNDIEKLYQGGSTSHPAFGDAGPGWVGIALGNFDRHNPIKCKGADDVSHIPMDLDSDGDGLTDREEQMGWYILVYKESSGDVVSVDCVASDSTVFDTDGDGLNDLQERDRGGNPLKGDTDRDGIRDNDDSPINGIENFSPLLKWVTSGKSLRVCRGVPCATLILEIEASDNASIKEITIDNKRFEKVTYERTVYAHRSYDISITVTDVNGNVTTDTVHINSALENLGDLGQRGLVGAYEYLAGGVETAQEVLDKVANVAWGRLEPVIRRLFSELVDSTTPNLGHFPTELKEPNSDDALQQGLESFISDYSREIPASDRIQEIFQQIGPVLDLIPNAEDILVEILVDVLSATGDDEIPGKIKAVVEIARNPTQDACVALNALSNALGVDISTDLGAQLKKPLSRTGLNVSSTDICSITQEIAGSFENTEDIFAVATVPELLARLPEGPEGQLPGVAISFSGEVDLYELLVGDPDPDNDGVNQFPSAGLKIVVLPWDGPVLDFYLDIDGVYPGVLTLFAGHPAVRAYPMFVPEVPGLTALDIPGLVPMSWAGFETWRGDPDRAFERLRLNEQSWLCCVRNALGELECYKPTKEEMKCKGRSLETSYDVSLISGGMRNRSGFSLESGPFSWSLYGTDGKLIDPLSPDLKLMDMASYGAVGLSIYLGTCDLGEKTCDFANFEAPIFQERGDDTEIHGNVLYDGFEDTGLPGWDRRIEGQGVIEQSNVAKSGSHSMRVGGGWSDIGYAATTLARTPQIPYAVEFWFRLDTASDFNGYNLWAPTTADGKPCDVTVQIHEQDRHLLLYTEAGQIHLRQNLPVNEWLRFKYLRENANSARLTIYKSNGDVLTDTYGDNVDINIPSDWLRDGDGDGDPGNDRIGRFGIGDASNSWWRGYVFYDDMRIYDEG